MEIILKKLGYALSIVKKNQSDVKVTLLFINNPNGQPRWVWNSNCSKPIFLKFYNVGSTRAWVFATLIQSIFFFRLQKIIFRKKSFFFSKEENPIFDCTANWALFMGTIGLNSKALLYANTCFYKIASSENAQKMIATECFILNEIGLNKSEIITPIASSITNDIIKLTDICVQGKRTKKFTAIHLKSLIEMATIQKKTVYLEEWELFKKTKEDFETINNERIPKNMIRKINTIIQNIPVNQQIELHLSQGDFTQWNMYETNGTLAVYDWELASFDRPKGFDYFHYIIQQGILVERKSWKFIYEDIINLNKNEKGNPLFNSDINTYLKLYLLINCISNLKNYAEHPNWYPQIHWTLEVWNEALNLFLEKEYTQRQLIIMDLFDLIHNQKYAALKFNNGYPEDLSINSDIDLIIDKQANKPMVEYLKNHALVSKITANKKSFMNSIHIFMKEESILSVDLIWQLKRQNYEILSAREIIANTIKNPYGIKNASPIDTARYIILFYILNNSKIPTKYLMYKQALTVSDEFLDFILMNYLENGDYELSIIDFFIKQKKENSHVYFIKNTLNYIMDTLKNNNHGNGFTITFSGVDGAGKSTVIEQLAYRIEKQIRRPVIILRHRPSLLPILSVWTKGKKKAYQDVNNGLPRQGNNKSFISSLFRFSYYYFDYLLGQFVIYFKYISRGYVVIYDRYYFDFINDSKRSNIFLSKSISSFGYQFLLKPKFNFFLFADAGVILNRKKELSKTTIEQLTHDYKNLFQALKAKSQFAIYESINNEDLEITLNQVVTTIIHNEK